MKKLLLMVMIITNCKEVIEEPYEWEKPLPESYCVVLQYGTGLVCSCKDEDKLIPCYVAEDEGYPLVEIKSTNDNKFNYRVIQ